MKIRDSSDVGEILYNEIEVGKWHGKRERGEYGRGESDRDVGRESLFFYNHRSCCCKEAQCILSK